MPHPISAVVVCGPSGVGKTTIGLLLAKEFDCPFAEGDDYHSTENVEKMRAGIALTDVDRAPWLQRLAQDVVAPVRGAGKVSVVLACSALRRRYRDVLRGVDPSSTAAHDAEPLRATDVFFVLLNGDVSVVSARLAKRKGHFMSPTLLASQMATLDALAPDEFGATVDFCDAPAVIAEKAAKAVRAAMAQPCLSSI